jgi:hypothetical protein
MTEYTKIYIEIYEALKADLIPNENLDVATRKITRAIWDIKLSTAYNLDFSNTMVAIQDIVNNGFQKKSRKKQNLNTNTYWFLN